MTQLLANIFGELGIAQYLDAFLEQGFDSWETILDITESDLYVRENVCGGELFARHADADGLGSDALGVKLGHRRVGTPFSILRPQAMCRMFPITDEGDGRGQQKLQRRIANSRGIAPEASLVSPTPSSADESRVQDAAVKVESPRLEGREPVGIVITKRKYRRHPKVGFSSPASETGPNPGGNAMG